MKRLAILLPVILCACGQPDNTHQLQAQVDSLKAVMAHSYRPGFGEFMSGIQLHHAKLWFAGQAQNWNLSQFELDEMEEALDGIKEYCTDRPEVKSIDMINAPMDSLASAVARKDLQAFKSHYLVLTNTCNNCHHATKHEFNIIKVPDSPPLSNQEFRPQINRD